MSAERAGLIDVELTEHEIIIRPRGVWKLWSLCRTKSIPRRSILSAHLSQQPDRELQPKSRRGLGTLASLAGYMRGPHGRSWWCYRYGRSAVVLRLDLARLNHAVFITDDDEAFIDALTQGVDIAA